MTELNQKLTKHSRIQRMLNTGHLHGKNLLCKNLGFKDGGECLVEGGLFSGTYGNKHKAWLAKWHKMYEYCEGVVVSVQSCFASF